MKRNELNLYSNQTTKKKLDSYFSNHSKYPKSNNPNSSTLSTHFIRFSSKLDKPPPAKRGLHHKREQNSSIYPEKKWLNSSS